MELFKNGFKKAKFYNELNGCYDLTPLRSMGVNLTAPKIHEIPFPQFFSQHIKKEFGYLNFGTSFEGFIRLNKVSVNETDLSYLARLKDLIPKPFKIVFSCRKIKRELSETHLKRKSKINEVGEGRVAARRYHETEKILEDISLNGDELFEFEFVICLSRYDATDLIKDAESAIHILKPIGDFELETYGAFPTYVSTLVGNPMHVSLKETQSGLTSYLPIVTSGEARKNPEVKERSIGIHRSDDSLSYIDVFDDKYDNFSVIISGKSGSGKSVLTNLVTDALYNDSNIEIIKVDVGGSHSKETQLLGGTEYKLNLNEPSGINPFSYINSTASNEEITNILASFVSVLILEEGESFLSKETRALIEEAVSIYVQSRPSNPSLFDFCKKTSSFPRLNLLKRWTTGVYSNAFKESDNSSNSNNRLTYYNFSEIFQANDPDFGQGGMAAVMAKFNFDMLTKRDKKLVFIADETPFFIRKCFNFFKFSTANVRKFGGSFITVTQRMSDLVVNDDTGIIDNSNTRMIFSIDGSEEKFQKIL
ncbi:MAG: hypothetical protein KDD37_10580, partial [Bdellovibrionales bacterium]|nr:hypothetical protein [Bdellovibrionales bacterium]